MVLKGDFIKANIAIMWGSYEIQDCNRWNNLILQKLRLFILLYCSRLKLIMAAIKRFFAIIINNRKLNWTQRIAAGGAAESGANSGTPIDGGGVLLVADGMRNGRPVFLLCLSHTAILRSNDNQPHRNVTSYLSTHLHVCTEQLNTPIFSVLTLPHMHHSSSACWNFFQRSSPHSSPPPPPPSPISIGLPTQLSWRSQFCLNK